jgi:hypothetical protein
MSEKNLPATIFVAMLMGYQAGEKIPAFVLKLEQYLRFIRFLSSSASGRKTGVRE